MASGLQEISASSGQLTLLAVFCAGIATSLGLCAVVRLPVVAAYVGGVGRSRRHGMILSALVAVGFIVGVVLLGLTAVPAQDGVGRVLCVSKYLFWAFGLGLFAIGLLISGLIDPQLLPEKWRPRSERWSRVGMPGAFLVGGAFGLLQTSACGSCGAELLALVEALVGHGSWLRSWILLIGFAVGQSIAVLAAGLLASLVAPDLVVHFRKWMCSIEPRIHLLVGNVLMVLGIYFVIVG